MEYILMTNFRIMLERVLAENHPVVPEISTWDEIRLIVDDWISDNVYYIDSEPHIDERLLTVRLAPQDAARSVLDDDDQWWDQYYPGMGGRWYDNDGHELRWVAGHVEHLDGNDPNLLTVRIAEA